MEPLPGRPVVRYTSQSPGTLLPTYTPGGATTASGYPNLAVYPSATRHEWRGPLPERHGRHPGPTRRLLRHREQGDRGRPAIPARQPTGTTLPLAPAYFPHIVRNGDGR